MDVPVSSLTRAVAERILSSGKIPFLHVYAGNTGAIDLYQALGFSLRRIIAMTVLTRAGTPLMTIFAPAAAGFFGA